ncbi:MAG: ABC transporter ATP-binding protein [Bacteroidia bacterium]
MIKASNISKSFGDLEVLRSIDLEINESEIVSIIGPSGAGKSTLLQILGTLENPSNGVISYNGAEITSLSKKKLAQFRNENIGFIFQFHHLLQEFTALENVCIPAFIGGVSKKEAEDKATKLLHRLGLGERLSHKPSELSGGEQQRVAVARALINDPKVVFADEPSGNLDSENALALHQLFLELRKEFNQSFVIVTHNLELAQLSDRTLSMKDGSIV